MVQYRPGLVNRGGGIKSIHVRMLYLISTHRSGKSISSGDLMCHVSAVSFQTD